MLIVIVLMFGLGGFVVNFWLISIFLWLVEWRFKDLDIVFDVELFIRMCELFVCGDFGIVVVVEVLDNFWNEVFDVV